MAFLGVVAIVGLPESRIALPFASAIALEHAIRVASVEVAIRGAFLNALLVE